MGKGAYILSGLFLLVALVVYRPPPWSFGPNKYLEDPIFAPVKTEETRLCEVASGGRIPEHLLHGIFLRNGANPIVTNHKPYHCKITLVL